MAERRGLSTPCTFCGETAYWHKLEALKLICHGGEGHSTFYTPCDVFDMRRLLGMKFTPKMRVDLERAGCVGSQMEFIL